MFEYIKGILVLKKPNYIVIDVNGIGYKIFMSENSMKSIGLIDTEVKVFTYLKVREDDISIYGFSTAEELKMFEFLISVSGVGAKSAITILSNIEPSLFAFAVVSNDVNSLKKLPGIGTKSAQRIILELKDKVKNMNDLEIMSSTEEINFKQENIEELISALQVLGYTRKEVENIIPKMNCENEDLEIMIKKALVLLSK